MPLPIDFISCTQADDAPVQPGNPWRFCGGLAHGYAGAQNRQQFDSADYPGTFLERAKGGRIWLDRLCGLWGPGQAPIAGTGLNGQAGYCTMRPPIYMDGIVDFCAPLADAAGPDRIMVGYFGSWPQGTSIAMLKNAIHWLSLSGFTHIGGDISAGLPSSHLQWSQWVPRVLDAGMKYICEPTMPLTRGTVHAVQYARCRLWDSAICHDQTYMGPGDGGGENFATIQLMADQAGRVSIVQQATAAGWTPVIDPAGFSSTDRATIGLAVPATSVSVTPPPPPPPAA